MLRSALYVSAAFLFLKAASGYNVAAPDQGPERLSYDDIVSLSATRSPNGPAGCKLEALLSTPVFSNAATRSGVRPKRPYSNGFGPVLRIVQWNLGGVQSYEMIRAALADAEGFRAHMAKRSTSELAVADAQVHELQQSDVLVLTETTVGVAGSGYRDVAADLARELRMNLAFGAEFVEADPLTLGLEQPKGDPKQLAGSRGHYPADRIHYQGIEGTAILSRYPILGARIVRLPDCYNWYDGEKAEIPALEKGRRWTGETVFDERVMRQVRHGGRMALIAELAVPESSTGVLTVVATHLENRAQPGCRRKQISNVLAAIRHIRGPVVVAGDMNTSGTDVTPTSVRRELSQRASSPEFWLGRVIRAFIPSAIASLGLTPLNHFKNYGDPLMFNIPILLPNLERPFFKLLERFRFSDGGGFDFGGSVTRTRDGYGGTLANSNDRSWKGFAYTYTLKRTFNEVVGVYKLDWFFVKPDTPNGKQPNGCCLAPHRPLTLNRLNEAPPERISDHAPIIVDLYLRQQP